MKQPRLLIIGAGPCGLGAAWRLHELGYSNFHVYEQSDHAGGLASSFIDPEGFTWDIGGHVLHSHYAYFDRMFEEVMGDDYFTHERESWVWISDRFVPYPFQNNIHRLPQKAMRECLDGLKKIAREKPQNVKNFADWIVASYGPGIAKYFLCPYNTKVWAYPPDKMNFQWVGDRVANVDIHRIEANIRDAQDDVAWGPNAVFHFPKHGGTGEIWRRAAKKFTGNISFQKNVKGIDLKKRVVQFSDNTTDEYDELLSTMPLDSLLHVITPSQLNKPFPLHFSFVAIVGIGVRGDVPERLRTKCWIYFPEDKAPFFRATVFSNYSPYNAPAGTWSLMTELSGSLYRPFPKGDLVDLVLFGARATHLITKQDTIVDTWLFQTHHGYPTPTLNRDRFLDTILPHLAKNHVFSRGRFGAWKYEVSNQDHTFMQGVEWVNHVLESGEEITLTKPGVVNAKKS